MDITSLIFDGANGQSAVFNTDDVPIVLFETHVDTRRESRPKVAGHGAWATKTWMDVRTFHLEGSVLADDPGSYMMKRMIIMGACTPSPELGHIATGTLRMTADGLREEIQAVCDVEGLPGMPIQGGYPSQSDLVVDFVSNDPICYGSTYQTYTTGTPSGGGGGLVFPMTFPIVFAGAGTGGDINVTNFGNATAYPSVTIYGPCVAPSISIVINGAIQTLAFDGLSLSAGEYVTIDFKARTAKTSSGGSVYSLITSGSTWWAIPTGVWTVVFNATAATAPSKAVIQLRNSYNI